MRGEGKGRFGKWTFVSGAQGSGDGDDVAGKVRSKNRTDRLSPAPLPTGAAPSPAPSQGGESGQLSIPRAYHHTSRPVPQWSGSTGWKLQLSEGQHIELIVQNVSR